MSLILNADYEWQLYSKEIKIESNPINQELEYFLFLLEEDFVYTTKKYDPIYIEHIKSLGGNVQITTLNENVKCWWGSYDNLDLAKKLNSKLTISKFAIENNLCHPQTEIIDENFVLKPNCIFKDPRGVSGKGIFKDFDLIKVKKVLKETNMVCEPFLDRIADISYLQLPDNQIIYQNYVDEHFQYKGTRMGNMQIPNELVEEFANAAKCVKDFMEINQAISPWSMDGFLYREHNKIKLYALSEVNYRKTMGYIAWKLHQLWNQNAVSELLLFSKNKIKTTKSYLNTSNIKELSPKGNRFAIFFFSAQSDEELEVIKKQFNQDFFV